MFTRFLNIPMVMKLWRKFQFNRAMSATKSLELETILYDNLQVSINAYLNFPLVMWQIIRLYDKKVMFAGRSKNVSCAFIAENGLTYQLRYATPESKTWQPPEGCNFSFYDERFPLHPKADVIN